MKLFLQLISFTRRSLLKEIQNKRIEKKFVNDAFIQIACLSLHSTFLKCLSGKTASEWVNVMC